MGKVEGLVLNIKRMLSSTNVLTLDVPLVKYFHITLYTFKPSSFCRYSKSARSSNPIATTVKLSSSLWLRVWSKQ